MQYLHCYYHPKVEQIGHFVSNCSACLLLKKRVQPVCPMVLSGGDDLQLSQLLPLPAIISPVQTPDGLTDVPAIDSIVVASEESPHGLLVSGGGRWHSAHSAITAREWCHCHN
ncbi:hypothetical protein ABZP36_016496 [Zizania latifolia]